MPAKYSNSFKHECVLSVMNSDKPLNILAEEFQVNPKTLYSWISHFKKTKKLTSRMLSNTRKEFSRESSSLKMIYKLQNENETLKQERDVLMKATAYFLKDLSK